MTTIEITSRDVAEHRHALHDWLRSHGLEPRTTATGLTVRDGQITADVYLLNERGEKYTIPNPDAMPGDLPQVAMETVTIPVLVPVPAGIGTVIE